MTTPTGDNTSNTTSNNKTFRDIKKKQDDLVLAATDLAAIVVPYGKTKDWNVVDGSTGNLIAPPSGSLSLGELQKSAGAELSPDMSTESIMGYGSRAARRVFVTEEGMTVNLTVQEVTKAALQMFHSIDDEDIMAGKAVTRMTKRASSSIKHYGLVLIAKDLAKNGEVFPYWVFPKVAITNKGSQSLSDSAEMAMPLTFTIFEDDGVQYELGFGGPGWPELAKQAGF